MYTALDCYTFGIALRYNCDLHILIGINVGVTLLAYSSGRTKELMGRTFFEHQLIRNVNLSSK